jgi:hypothetical protein
LRPFAPGLPVELNSSLFFDQRGYLGRAEGAVGWDVAHDLGEYQISNLKYPTSKVDIRPAQPGQEEALLEFFSAIPPQQFEFKNSSLKAKSSDYVLVDRARRGRFAQLTLMILSGLERFTYHHSLQLGSSWSDDCRGKGYGGTARRRFAPLARARRSRLRD